MKQDILTIIVILLNIEYRVLGQSATLTVPSGLQGSSCRLTCTVTAASAVTFKLKGVSQGSCPFANDPASCNSGNHNISQIGNDTYLDITSLDYSRDDGTWTCENSVQNKNGYLFVFSPMQDISLSFSTTGSVSEGETVTVTAEMKCQYTNSSFTKFSLYKKEKKAGIAQEVNSTTSFYSYNSSSDGCQSHEQNIVATFSVSSSQACGETQMYAVFNHSYLGSKTGSLSSALNFPACPTVAQCDYNWHILIGWVIGILIIPIAGFIFFMFQKHSGGSDKKCDGKFKKFGILVGAVLGGGALLALIICIIIATQVCLSQLGDAIGIGIGVSFGIMFMCVIIIVIVYFTCMKEKPDGDVIKPTTDKSEETNGKNNQIAPEKNESKNKALDDVPKGRQLPSPRKDDEENKIRMPRSLPPINHEENSTSSPKKKKKKRKSKENENEDKSE